MVAVPQQLSDQQSIEFQLREPEVKQLDIVIRLEHAESGKRALRDHGWFALVPCYCTVDDVAEGRLTQSRSATRRRMSR
jgi:hypothetical protein